ncbi:GGDEF domain-containing protein [Klenkia sp. LSe6-5]|uniref:GGDEF domain-containing protein n=1 Tax=Klenkia sesuvii TaxID=3103137 RepID=A0ABU8DY43_9ACTN
MTCPDGVNGLQGVVPAADEAGVTTLLDLDATTLLPTRVALLDVLALRRPAAGTAPTSGLVVVGLPVDAEPVGAGVLVDACAGLTRALRPGDWLARSGPAEFAAVVEGDLVASAGRLVAAVGRSASAGVFPVTRDRRPDDVLRLATLGLTLARLDGPGSVVRYPVA